jgi:hypothetical protein
VLVLSTRPGFAGNSVVVSIVAFPVTRLALSRGSQAHSAGKSAVGYSIVRVPPSRPRASARSVACAVIEITVEQQLQV